MPSPLRRKLRRLCQAFNSVKAAFSWCSRQAVGAKAGVYPRSHALLRGTARLFLRRWTAPLANGAFVSGFNSSCARWIDRPSVSTARSCRGRRGDKSRGSACQWPMPMNSGRALIRFRQSVTPTSRRRQRSRAARDRDRPPHRTDSAFLLRSISVTFQERKRSNPPEIAISAQVFAPSVFSAGVYKLRALLKSP